MLYWDLVTLHTPQGNFLMTFVNLFGDFSLVTFLVTFGNFFGDFWPTGFFSFRQKLSKTLCSEYIKLFLGAIISRLAMLQTRPSDCK